MQNLINLFYFLVFHCAIVKCYITEGKCKMLISKIIFRVMSCLPRLTLDKEKKLNELHVRALLQLRSMFAQQRYSQP
jgi:hypothetical protein